MAAFDEQEYTKSFDWKIWKRLLPLLKPYRSAFAGMLLFNGICARPTFISMRMEFRLNATTDRA